MVQLQSTAITKKVTDKNTLIRRNRNINFSEKAESAVECFAKQEKLPVFIFPLELYFYLDDTNSLTQKVRIHNPYSWPFIFEIHASKNGLWEIKKPRDIISANCFCEVFVSPLNISPSLIGQIDSLAVHMKGVSDSLTLGTRILPCKFLAGKRPEAIQTDLFSLNSNSCQDELIETPAPTVKKPPAPTAKSATSKSDIQGANRKKSKNETSSNWPPSAYVLTAIMCGIILCLPTEECFLPTYLVISHTPKYIAAYVLGIITSLLCKYY